MREFLNLSLLFDKNSFTDFYLTWHVNVTVKMQFHCSLLLIFLLLLDFYYFLIISLLLLLLYRQLYKYTVNLGVENLTFILMIFFLSLI